MRKVGLAFVIAGLLAVWAAPASAVVLYDNGGPDDALGYFSDTQNTTGALYIAYNQFTLSSAATITGMEWWGFYYSGNTPPASGDIFDYDIQSNPGGGGQPSGDITSGVLGSLAVTDTGTLDQGLFEVYKYDASASVTLPAGTYYLSIYDTVSNPGNTFAWCESTVSAVGTSEWSYDTSGAFGWLGSPEVGLAFNLTGGAAVPEPATMTLFGLGLAGLVSKLARRKNR
jgi:hypothetical protein